MKRLVDHQIQNMTRCSRHALIIALSALLLPMVVWAHKCGPEEVTVEKGNFIWYKIIGEHHVPSYEIVDKGDPLVAMIEPPTDIHNPHLYFKIIGKGEGTTMFSIYWKADEQGTCSIKVTSG